MTQSAVACGAGKDGSPVWNDATRQRYPLASAGRIGVFGRDSEDSRAGYGGLLC